MGEPGDRHRAWEPQADSALCFGTRTVLPGFIKELRYVAAFQNPQQAMYSLRETVLKNSMPKQNQQAIGALAIGGLVILALVGVSKTS